MQGALGWMVVGLCSWATATGVQKLEPARYGWFNDYAAARAEARRTGKPIFLVFRCEP